MGARMGLRPSFELEVELPSRELIQRLADALATGSMTLKRTRPPGGGPERGTRDAAHLLLTVPTADQHFWSPWLTIEVSPREGHAHVLGQFSPHPSVWTGFALGYLMMTVLFVLSLIGAATWLMISAGQLAALWVTAGAAAAMFGMWTASQIGQRLAQPQMETLRGELERAIAAVRPAAPA